MSRRQTKDEIQLYKIKNYWGYCGASELLWAAFLLLPALAQRPEVWLEWSRGGHPLHQAELQRPVRHPRQVQGEVDGNIRLSIESQCQELHCCVGPSYEKLEWFKDGVKFPWHSNENKDRNIILYRSPWTGGSFIFNIIYFKQQPVTDHHGRQEGGLGAVHLRGGVRGRVQGEPHHQARELPTPGVLPSPDME